VSEQAQPGGRAGRAAPAGTPPLVLPLHELGRRDLAVAGGKGANLGELVRAGFPVPPGFVVTTAAYDRFVADNRLGETIARALHEERGSGAAIRDAFEGALIPPEVGRDILAAYHRLGQGPVAVRSSATAEDLPQAAFAGQQDTFLNVVGTEALLDAVRRCWASLWSERAIAYRERQGLDRQTVKLAVVVQRLVAAEAAGVLFTANPVTGARDETVVDASPGLGEAVVSGLVTPDHYVLRKGRWGWRIVERRPGRREVVVQPRAAGGTEHVAPDTAAAPQPALPGYPLRRSALRRLARLGAAIERHFGGPQDVEWAWTGGTLFIVQARPITALPGPLPRPSRLARVMASLMAEMLPVRPYPLEVTTWGPGLVISALLGPMLRMCGLALRVDRLFVEEDGMLVRLSGRLPIRPIPGILLAPLRIVRQARRYDPARWRADLLLAEAQARARALEARDLRALSWADLLATVRAALAIPPLLGEVRLRYVPGAALAIGRLRVALGLLGRADRLGALLSGVETKTLETNRALEALAARIRSDPTLADAFARHEPAELWFVLEAQPSGRAWLAELRVFLDRYGHREAGGTMLVSQSTWKDAPEAVLGMLKGLALAERRPQPERPAWDAARDELLAHPLLRLSPLRSAFLELLAQARCFPQLREDTRFYATLILPILRRTLLELGRRLATAGILDAPEDVFHLRLDELERVDGTWPPPRQLADELRELVRRRKARRAALEGTPLVDPRLLRWAAPEGGALLRGTPGSPGVAEGPVRVVREAAEFGRLRPGEVLVAPYTNPAWTPLFQQAVAVIVDSGGAMSHAAIVAREYGIPAVLGTGDGTRRLVDGEWVRVDGTRGLIFGAAARTTGHDGAAQPG
jgi:pyruvate,water dikinase